MNDKLAPKQVADVILETVKTQKPETTQQLVAAVHEKTAFSKRNHGCPNQTEKRRLTSIYP
jgi:16S rRNA C1402 N4-methylase RsmH